MITKENTTKKHQANDPLFLLNLGLKDLSLEDSIRQICIHHGCSIAATDINGLPLAHYGTIFQGLFDGENWNDINKIATKRVMHYRYHKLGTIYFWNVASLSATYLNQITQLLANTVWRNHMVSSANTMLEDQLVHLLVNRQKTLLQKKMAANHIYLPHSFAFIFVKPEFSVSSKLKNHLQIEFAHELDFSISSIYQDILISLVGMPITSYYDRDLLHILKTIAKQYNVQLLIANPCSDVLKLRSSYLAGRLCYQNLNQNNQVNFIYQQSLALFSKGLFQRNLSENFAPPVVSFLEQYDKKSGKPLLQTLFAFINNDCNIEKTAISLYMHRNTVHNHLRQIQSLTGFNFRHFSDLFWVKQHMLLQEVNLKM